MLLPAGASRGMIVTQQPAVDPPPGGGRPEAVVMCRDVLVFTVAIIIRRDAGGGEEVVVNLPVDASLLLCIFGLEEGGRGNKFKNIEKGEIKTCLDQKPVSTKAGFEQNRFRDRPLEAASNLTEPGPSRSCGGSHHVFLFV